MLSYTIRPTINTIRSRRTKRDQTYKNDEKYLRFEKLESDRSFSPHQES